MEKDRVICGIRKGGTVMSFWEKVKKDLEKGIKDGIYVVREGVSRVGAKTEELTEEGRRRYRIFELKNKVRRWTADLGGRVYELSSEIENPMLDTKVKLMVSRIRKLENQIGRLERRGGGAGRRR